MYDTSILMTLTFLINSKRRYLLQVQVIQGCMRSKAQVIIHDLLIFGNHAIMCLWITDLRKQDIHVHVQ